MQAPQASIIAAIGQHREMGRNNDLIWRIPDDLKRVKALTMGHPLVMGRKTFDSIGRPLPGRTNIVISRSVAEISGAVVAGSLEDAFEKARAAEGGDEIFIFGGASVYEQALPLADRLYLTLIDGKSPDADIFFPPYEHEFQKVAGREQREHEGLTYEWVTLER